MCRIFSCFAALIANRKTEQESHGQPLGPVSHKSDSPISTSRQLASKRESLQTLSATFAGSSTRDNSESFEKQPPIYCLSVELIQHIATILPASIWWGRLYTKIFTDFLTIVRWTHIKKQPYSSIRSCNSARCIEFAELDQWKCMSSQRRDRIPIP